MDKIKISDVKPQNNNVLVEIVDLDTVSDGIYVGNKNATETDAMPIEFWLGKALSLGKTAADDKFCPGLEKDDYVYFSQFSGVIAPTENTYTKVIPGYNIVAISKDSNMDITTIQPTNDRILVELIKDTKVEDGVFSDTSSDPRENITSKGKVISCGVNADLYEPGTIVYFEPFCGNLIIKNSDQEIKTINSADVLFAV